MELECSFLTSKRRVYLNRKLEFNGHKKLGKSFHYVLYVDRHILTIDNRGNEADLLVDNQSFNQVYGRKIWQQAYGPSQPQNEAPTQEKDVERPIFAEQLAEMEDSPRNPQQAQLARNFLELDDEEPAQPPEVKANSDFDILFEGESKPKDKYVDLLFS